VRTVWLPTAELIVVGRRRGPVFEVLHLAPPPEVADGDVELPVGTEREDTAVMVAPRRLR
jgi:hypothetical protein